MDEWPTSLGQLYAARGEAELHMIPGVGKSIASEIARWIEREPEK